jgi:WD40 repeat protein/Flp pilus assembly protein TadD
MGSIPSVNDLLERWHEMRQQGRTLSLEQLCADCPERAAHLREHVRAAAAMEPFLAVAGGADIATLPPPRAGGNAGDVTLAPSSGPRQADPTDVLIPGYEVLRELGRGGMGVVYQARQVGLNRLVALKMILAGSHAGPEDLARFRTEAEAVAQLQHPNIVQIYEIGQHRGLPFFSLEYVDGGSLAQQLNGTPIPSRQAAALIETLTHAVHAAHQHGIVHRDLKPANVLLSFSGRSESGAGSASAIPKIADFGLAKRLDVEHGQTQSGSIVGTPSYMAPEQAGGKTKAVGPAADVYALGAILYELLTGRPPFRAATPLDTVLMVLAEEPVPPRRLQPKVPRDLETICLKCLHKEPGKRYAMAEALAEDLRRFLDDRPIVARPASWAERGWRWCKRNRAVAASLAAVAGALLAGSVASTLFGIQAHRNAEQARTMAEEARQEKVHAQDAADTARRAEGRATEQEAQARELAASLQRNLYDVQLNAARKSLDDGLPGVALDQLERLRPARPGDPDLRGFEWFHLYRRCLPADHQVLYGSPGTVNALAWSPDGKLLASASANDVAIRLWDAVTGRQLRVLSGHQGGVYRVCFSPDGTRLASAGNDGTMRIWRVVNGRELHVARAPGGPLRCVAWRPDGKELASVGADGAIHLWDAATGESTGSLIGPRSPTMSVAYSPDGKQLVTGSDNKDVCLWDVAGGKLVRTFRGHTDPIYEVAFSPDGKLLGSAAADATARLWNVATGDERRVLRGHNGFVRGIAFSPDGTRVATACDDRLVRVWETGTGKEVRRFAGHGGLAWPVAFQPGGKRLASGSDDHTLRIWDLDAEPGVRNLMGAGVVAFSPDGRQLGTLTLLGRVHFTDLEQPAQQGPVLGGHWGEVVRLLPSRDRRYLATLGSTDGTARLWDATNGKSLLVVHDKVTQVLLALALDPACKYLATAGTGPRIRVWDATPAPDGKERVKPLREWRSPAPMVFGLAFSPDGRLLASADTDGVMRLWDVATGRLVRECHGHEGMLWTVAFHPDGKEVASAGADRKVIIWEVATGKQVRVLHGFPQAVVKVAYSPDGERLATLASEIQRLFAARENAPGEVKVWDARTGEELFADRGLARAPWELAFSPDGRRLAVSSQGTVWEKDVRLFEGAETAGKTEDWTTLYRDAFDRPERGPAWRVESGRWSLQQGALRGAAGAGGLAAIDLRGPDLPDRVDVRYEFWVPHAGSCECRLLDKSGRHGVLVNLQQSAPTASNSEVTVAVEEDGENSRIGGVSGISLEPGVHHQVRLVRQGPWLALWLDGREVAGAVAPDRPEPRLRFQARLGQAGKTIFLANLEVRAPADAVRRRQLRSLVEGLWDKQLLRDPVRAQVEVRNDLSAEEKKWCLGVVDQFAEDPERLDQASWNKVRKPDLAAEEYALALRQAQAACRADPDHRHYLGALGLAQMRVGQYTQAVDTLQRAADLTRQETGAAGPAHHAGLAMAYQRLGKVEAARQHIRRMRDLLRGEFRPFQASALRPLFAEATALVAAPASPDEDAIKELVIRSEDDGWMRHRLADHLAAYTDDAHVRVGRGEQPGPHDQVLDRRQLEAVRRVQFQGPPAAPTVHSSHEDVKVHIQGGEAELRCRAVAHFSADSYQAYDCRFHLRRTGGGYRIDTMSSWPVEEQLGGRHTVYTAATWAERDAEADRLAKSADLVPRIRALKEARRWADAHALACRLADEDPNRALGWSLRGETALEIGATADAHSAFQKARNLDPGVEVPWYLTRQRLAFRAHQSAVAGLAFHPDGRRIVSGGWDKRARLWDAATGRELRRFAGQEQAVRCAAFSPDGKVLATGADNLRLWDVETGRPLHVCNGHTGIIYRLAFSPDGRRIVTASADRTARVWDVGAGRQLHVLSGHADEVLGAAFSPDGHWIATASHDQTAKLWDAMTYAEVRTFEGHTGVVKRVEFSPDGKHLATSSGDRTIKLWSVATGKVERTLQGHDQLVDVVRFSPDGRWLASGDNGGTVRTWDAATGKLQYVLRGHTGAVFVLAFRPDGQVLASGGSDGVFLWDLRP